MTRWILLGVFFMATVMAAGSKDKSPKVTYREMALEMRDAFNCGVLIEEHLHGRLKDNAELYTKERVTYNCDHVEAVLNTLDDQNNPPPKQ
jgi:hypothetical protein